MAYMSQDRKAEIVKAAKAVLTKYGVKATFAVCNHSTIVCNIKSGKIDFLKNYNEVAETMNYSAHLRTVAEESAYIDVNPYHYRNHFSGVARNFMEELFAALNNGNWDKSDIQTDYFNVGWYVDVNVGKWNKPYILEK